MAWLKNDKTGVETQFVNTDWLKLMIWRRSLDGAQPIRLIGVMVGAATAGPISSGAEEIVIGQVATAAAQTTMISTVDGIISTNRTILDSGAGNEPGFS